MTKKTDGYVTYISNNKKFLQFTPPYVGGSVPSLCELRSQHQK